MFKKYKKQLIISSIVTLLPTVFGLLMWDQLPDIFVTHWAADGEANGWSSKAFAVFFMPLFLVGMNIFCAWITDRTNRGREQSPKVMNLVFWLIPVLSLACNGMVYSIALGKTWEATAVLPILLGLLFTLIGNYLPKCTRNTSIGIKVIWALNNEENWNATHRFAGKVWVAAGLITLLSGFLPMSVGYPVMFVSLMGSGLVPTLYSYLYYRKQLKNGTAVPTKDAPVDKDIRKARRISWPMVIAILIFCAFIMFVGSIEFEFREDALVMDATFYSPVSVSYDSIDSIEYLESDVPGIRTAGFNSMKLLLGNFQNDEFGNYTRYTYYRPDACIVVTSEGRTLVFSGRDAAETQALYQELLNRIGS